MNGRILSERLLATTSLAALLLAGSGQQNADAACVTDPGGNASNSGTISCVVIDNSGTSSFTNNAGGVIGPPPAGTSAISITSTATLSGGITNAGHIIGPSATTHLAVGIGDDGLVQGGISNSGSIVVNTSAAGFVGAFGIDIGNGLGSPVTEVTSFGGGLTNSGTISVNGQGTGLYFAVFLNASTFSGDVVNTPTGTIAVSKASGLGQAMVLTGDTFTGSFVNAGMVSAVDTVVTGGADILAMSIGVGTMTGGVTNNGTISASAVATSPTGAADALALFVIANSLAGAIINTGTIAGTATSTNGQAGVFGLNVSGGVFSGGLSNGGTISANASISGSTNANGANAVALGLNSSTFSGAIVNSGTIAGVATSTAGGAQGFGISVAGSVFSGGLSNGGTISGSATAIAASGGFITAFGIALLASTFSAGVVNSGTILATAQSQSTADAFAMSLSGVKFLAGVTNTGTVSGTATAGFAIASGISITASTFNASVVNNGMISGAANGSRAALAVGIGVGFSSITSFIVSTFAGTITNSGTVLASATAPGGVATASGIAIHVSTFNGSVVNSGSIAAVASGSAAFAAGLALFDGTYLGGITNIGSIMASATAGAGVASATGILLCECVGPFSNGVINSGTILATAQSQNVARAFGTSLDSMTFLGGFTNNGTISGIANAGGVAKAFGFGIGVEETGVGTSVSLFSGGITNSGTLSASASATGVGGFAVATGARIYVDRFAGNVSNSGGTIAAVAQVVNGTAIANGVLVEAETVFAGNIVNSGTIVATAINSGISGSFVEASGLDIFAASFGGTITNSGVILATASIAGGGDADAFGMRIVGETTFVGGITNSGSIVARASSSGAGNAVGLLVRTSSFSGNIVNSGTIAGLNAGSGSGVGVRFDCGAAVALTNSGTITGSTWGIDASNGGGSGATINQTGGLISGGNGTSGGAILLSSAADTVNIRGGQISGNIVGGGAANIVNVQMGSGTFSYAGQVTNVGTVNVSSGTLLLLTSAGVSTINYNQSASSTLALEVSPATNNRASISASGAISLASGAVLQAVEGDFAWTPGTYSYGAVVTAGSTTGSFTATSNSPFFVASLAQSSTVDNLTLTMLSPSQVPGLNANQQSVANAIIGISGGNGTLDQLFTLSNPGPALTQLSGSQFTTTNYQPLIQAWQMFTDSLSDRLSQGDGYGGTVSASYDATRGIQFAQANIPQVAQMSDAGQAPASAPHQWGLWARGYGLSSNASSTATSAPYSESGAGLIIGADNQITDRIVAGVALNVATDKASVTGGGFTQSDAYQGSAYGQYAIDPNWYVNGIAGFSWQTYKTARVVSFITTNVNNGSFDGQSYRLYGESGYTLRPAMLPLTRITPYLGLGYLHAHTDGYTETGSATALTVQAMDPNSFTTTIGARAAATFQIGATSFRPELRVAWQHEFLDQAATMRAAFVTAPGSAVFTATGTGFGRESFLGGAGVTTMITSSTQVFFDYDAKVNGGYTAQAVSGGLRVQF